jgi:cytochrome c2
MHRLLLPLLFLGFALSSPAASPAKDEKPAKKKKAKEKPDENAMAYASQFHWADWVEPDFPFFSSVLDAREIGEGFPKDNLTPRGLILNLGHNLWACFDTDLLRIACIWQGEEGKPPITQTALAPGSYHIAGQKTKDGEDDLPTPIGTVWIANGLYPGWQVLKSPDDKPNFTDPRTPTPDKEELGRGPLDEKLGQFGHILRIKKTPILSYTVAGDKVIESYEMMDAGPTFSSHPTRTIGIGPHKQPLVTIISKIVEQNTVKDGKGNSLREKYAVERFAGAYLAGQNDNGIEIRSTTEGYAYLYFPASEKDQYAILGYLSNPVEYPPTPPVLLKHSEGIGTFWPQTVTTHATLSKKDDAYVVDDIPLPLENPWKRNIRLADLAFLDDQGNAVAVTMDGDVWKISGLKDNLENVTWKRFASGLHEPMSIVVRPAATSGKRKAEPSGARQTAKQPEGRGGQPSQNEHPEIFVFDRDGIWRLRDKNGDGEAEVYDMFCNRFAQTAETREFPNSMKLAPDGSLVLSKGGQQGTYLGKDNGTVIRVSPDGKKYDVIGWGLRQPFAGVNPKTGLVTASDQEGNYVPTTPIQIIRDHQFYGHLATIQPHEQYPQSIAEPLTWIPHAVVASGATQTWLYDAKMGDINDEMILVSYNKPELFRVLMNNRGTRPQATVTGWIHHLDFPTLNAVVNPADGQLYAIGFQIWGTTVKRISGLARIRHTESPRVLLTGLTPCDKGVLLNFNRALEKAHATDIANYSVERWNYKRTFNYGSPHLKADGTPGQEWMPPSSAYLSKDGKSVFIGLPDMKTTYMQMRVGWGLKGADGLPAQNNAYFTPYELIKFEPEKEGFDKIEVDLTPRQMVAAAAVKPTKEEGERLYQMMGCMACHSIDGTVYGKVGPSWKGLYGSERILAKGGDKAIANDDYIKESIQNPSAKVVKGFEKLDAGMPIYAGVLNDSQIESLILFIKSLK